jgi:hypothetical protein
LPLIGEAAFVVASPLRCPVSSKPEDAAALASAFEANDDVVAPCARSWRTASARDAQLGSILK